MVLEGGATVSTHLLVRCNLAITTRFSVWESEFRNWLWIGMHMNVTERSLKYEKLQNQRWDSQSLWRLQFLAHKMYIILFQKGRVSIFAKKQFIGIFLKHSAITALTISVCPLANDYFIQFIYPLRINSIHWSYYRPHMTESLSGTQRRKDT